MTGDSPEVDPRGFTLDYCRGWWIVLDPWQGSHSVHQYERDAVAACEALNDLWALELPLEVGP
jgi:hypothetical protein